MKPHTFALILAALLATTLAAGALAQDKTPKLYKWVDKQGVVHYGSSVPPEYANQQLDVLNSQGVTIKTLNAPKTPAEIAKEQQTQAAVAEKTQQDEQQQANDQMLRDTYTSVLDIQRDRDSRLAAMDSQIKLTNNAISGLQKTLADYQARATELTQAHKPVPANLKNSMDSVQQQLEADQQLLLQQQQSEQATRERYEAYITRFKQLQGNGGG
jgi:chromosome segregation ATPase